MKKLKHVFYILEMKKWWQDSEIPCKRNGIASSILALAALLMLIMNIKNHSTTMIHCSIVLVIGFCLSALASFCFKKPHISSGIIVILVGLILSIFAITGGNEGFAILWVLLVPFFSVGLLGPKSGVILSGYFLIFILMLFYGPINYLIEGKYPATYLSRFPVLYTCDCFISLLLALQAEYFDRLAHIRSYEDELTGLFSRHYFMEKINQISLDDLENLNLVIIDINGLKETNDTQGHLVGDELIKAFVSCSKEVFDENALLSRIGGDEFAFLVFLPDEEVHHKLLLLKEKASNWQSQHIHTFSFASGCASKRQYPDCDMRLLLKLADQQMYEDKKNYYKEQNQ